MVHFFETIDLESLKAIAYEASEAVMKIYQNDFLVAYKEDLTPLTIADTKANEIICKRLQTLFPSIPIMSEENDTIDYEVRKEWEYYWCIDPIDGTKEFVEKNGEFTINIALIHNKKPVIGVVYAPTTDEMYSAKKGFGAYKNGQKLPLKINNKPKDFLTVVTSKSHFSEQTKMFIEKLADKEIKLISKGSSLKLCMVAEGTADIYPRLSPTMEWDTAAADIVVRESGKMVYRYDENIQCNDFETMRLHLKPMIYNKTNLLNPFFVVF